MYNFENLRKVKSVPCLVQSQYFLHYGSAHVKFHRSYLQQAELASAAIKKRHYRLLQHILTSLHTILAVKRMSFT